MSAASTALAAPAHDPRDDDGAEDKDRDAAAMAAFARSSINRCSNSIGSIAAMLIADARSACRVGSNGGAGLGGNGWRSGPLLCSCCSCCGVASRPAGTMLGETPPPPAIGLGELEAVAALSARARAFSSLSRDAKSIAGF